MACITDMDGNVLYIVLDDNTVADAEGNPVESIPYITMSVNEALTCELNTNE